MSDWKCCLLYHTGVENILYLTFVDTNDSCEWMISSAPTVMVSLIYMACYRLWTGQISTELSDHTLQFECDSFSVGLTSTRGRGPRWEPPSFEDPIRAAIRGFSSLPSVMTWKRRSKRYSAVRGRTLPLPAAADVCSLLINAYHLLY